MFMKPRYALTVRQSVQSVQLVMVRLMVGAAGDPGVWYAAGRKPHALSGGYSSVRSSVTSVRTMPPVPQQESAE